MICSDLKGVVFVQKSNLKIVVKKSSKQKRAFNSLTISY